MKNFEQGSRKQLSSGGTTNHRQSPIPVEKVHPTSVQFPMYGLSIGDSFPQENRVGQNSVASAPPASRRFPSRGAPRRGGAAGALRRGGAARGQLPEGGGLPGGRGGGGGGEIRGHSAWRRNPVRIPKRNHRLVLVSTGKQGVSHCLKVVQDFVHAVDGRNLFRSSWYGLSQHLSGSHRRCRISIFI